MRTTFMDISIIVETNHLSKIVVKYDNTVVSFLIDLYSKSNECAFKDNETGYSYNIEFRNGI